VNVLSFKKSPLYAAFNKETDDKLIKTLNKNNAQMKKSGEIKKIQDKYFH
jgi:ABC-type amino acid transport substrate-binding protein